MSFKLKIVGIIKIIRPLNFVITFASAVIAVLIASADEVPVIKMLLAGTAASFVMAGGNIINDYFDVEIDKINRPGRPIPSGQVSKSSALILYIFFTVLGLACSHFININAFLIVIFSIIVIFLYSYRLKRIALGGNLLISGLTGLTFIFGAIVVNNAAAGIIPAYFAFHTNLIREIIKDMQDIKGDKANNIITLPQKIGKNNSKNLIGGLLIILIPLAQLPYFFAIYSILYFAIVVALVTIPVLYSLNILYSDEFDQNLCKLSFSLKLIMITGLAAIYAGSV